MKKRGLENKQKKNHNHSSIEEHLIFGSRTFGQRAADNLTSIAGSWGFIFGFFIFLFTWMTLNAFWLLEQSWDPYPFILLNLVLSSLAAIQAPVILMSQNRQSQKDRMRVEYDYSVDRKAEREIRELREQLDRIEKHLKK